MELIMDLYMEALVSTELFMESRVKRFMRIRLTERVAINEMTVYWIIKLLKNPLIFNVVLKVPFLLQI